MMVALGVALAWVAMSAVSFRWLAAFERASASAGGEADPALLADDGAFAYEALYPLELSPLPAGGPR